ncbi:MAG: DNA-processing protein DprA [Actinomycetota bacterium]|nr:DNA-processing protein DprA [Actinomycetota bacterium]
MIEACDGCLRRGHLVGRLAAPIARLLDQRGRREPGLLALEDHDLVAAVAGDGIEEAVRFLDGFDPRVARRELSARSLGALCRHAARYPEPLLRLGDPPAVLFVAGSSGPLMRMTAEPAVALVGTRNASAYGLEMAYELGRGLGAAGVSVVSGLALGIDAAAHRGCLDARGTGVAVLAGGADVPYPRTNSGLYRSMLACGTVISELPPGQRAYRWAFPARNRIMAGLAAVIVVVEAAEPSGSLITSTFAEQLGRTVAAVPGRATSRLSAGNNRLLKDGALMVTSARDILDELYGVGVEPRARPQAQAGGDAEAEGGLDAVEQRVLDAIEAGLGIDGLCAHSGLPAREARALLSRLESSGHLRRDGLGGYRRTAAIR